MSVECERFLGYSIDVKDLWDDLCQKDTKAYEKWIDNEDNKLSDKNFASYWHHNRKELENKIILLDDGMSGEYTKLLYIVQYDDSVEEDSEEFIQALNKYLAESPVPDDIRKQLTEIFIEIFGINDISIKLEYIVHYS